MNQINQQIGHKIKTKRRKIGITQADLSRKLSISPSYLNLMESGKRKINLDLLLKNSNQSIDFIFFLNVNKETIIKRIKKRKIIEKRTDDDLETILKRYDTYMETTKPVLESYAQYPNFHDIDGTLEIDDITLKIQGFLNV